LYKNGFVYRFATAEEIPVVAELHEKVFETAGYAAEDFIKYAGHKGSAVLVAMFRTRVIAYVLTQESQQRGSEHTDLNIVFAGCVKGQRRQGHASTLLDMTKEMRREKSYRCIYLQVDYSFPQAAHCYEANCFVVSKLWAGEFMFFPEEPTDV
jgi:ribosomal protein S18 acetylase RimI-like enzyme